MNRKKLFIGITLAIVLLLVISGFITSIYIRNKLTENLITQYGVQEEVLAGQFAQLLQVEIAQTQAKLKIIAKLPEVMSGNKEECNKKLKEVFDEPETKVGNLGRVWEDGFFHCSLNEKLIGVKAETLGSYITDIFNDPEHKPVMSRAIKPVGSPSYLVGIHVPVWDNEGKFIGTLGGAVYFNDLGKTYLKNVKIAPGANVALFDDDGTILYHNRYELIGLNLTSADYQQYLVGGIPPQEAIQGIKDGTAGTRRYTFDGDEKIAAFTPVYIFPGRNWRILINVPIQAARDDISTVEAGRFLIQLPIILSLITLGLFGFFLWITKREVFNPMDEVDKAKTEFVSLASHQLRTPLSSINWYTEMLLAEDAGKINDEQKKFLNEVYTGSKRMVELVNALLNTSRIELGTFAVDPVPTDVVKLAQSVIDEQMQQIDKQKIAFTKNLSKDIPIIKIDPKLLRMVIQNLLSNAVKYTPEGGAIELEMKLENKNVLIKVVDNGWGIPKDQHDKIFTKLFRADNVREKDAEGTGLGLYIVKSIIDHAGGSIRFESEKDKGTTFYVVLPISGMVKKEGTTYFA